MMCGAECVSTVEATLTEGREEEEAQPEVHPQGRWSLLRSSGPEQVWPGHIVRKGGDPVSEAEQHFHLQEEDGSKEMLRRALLLSASIKAAHGRDALKFISLWLLCS